MGFSRNQAFVLPFWKHVSHLINAWGFKGEVGAENKAALARSPQGDLRSIPQVCSPFEARASPFGSPPKTTLEKRGFQVSVVNMDLTHWQLCRNLCRLNYPCMKKIILFTALLTLAAAKAHALTISAFSLSNTTINAETTGTQTGTTVQFTLDGGPSNVTINIYRTVNGTDNTLVHTIETAGLSAGANTVFWNGLWLIDGENARINGNYRFTIDASSTGATATMVTIGSLLQINSVDIHNISIQSSRDSNQNAAPPYTINYRLAKNALVTARVRNSAGATIRTLALNQAGLGEDFDSSSGPVSNVLTWNGLGDDGHPVSNDVYTLILDATDTGNSDRATTRSRTMALQSVASAGADSQKLFEDNTFLYPNPIRAGSATIQMQAVRSGASLSLKIYTIAGDLVRDEHFDGIAAGNIVSYAWDVTNQSGHKLGRGLYFYVVREKDSEGTLQTVKKMAVIQ